jgi:hypothetical protein
LAAHKDTPGTDIPSFDFLSSIRSREPEIFAGLLDHNFSLSVSIPLDRGTGELVLAGHFSTNCR